MVTRTEWWIGVAMTVAGVVATPVMAGGGDETLLYGRPLAPGALAVNCFSRDYDAAHLRAHPRQRVVAAKLLSYRPDWPGGESIVNLEFRFRGVAKPYQLSGGCKAVEGKADRLDCGIECDGGGFTLRRNANGALLLDIPEGLNLCDGDETLPRQVRFGRDDKLFRLDGATVDACAGLIWDDEMRPKLLENAPKAP